MNWLRNNWYYLGGVIFVILAFVVGLFGGEMDPRLRLAILLYMTLLIHQFEEYACPGGFPLAWNAGASAERELYDRYPMNKKGSMFSNVSFWIVYALVIFFYEIPMLVIMLSYVGFGQLMMHGVMINKKAGTKYNPGMATAIVVMVPVGIYTIWYYATNYTLAAWNWWGAALILVVLLITLLALPLKVTMDKASPYRYTEEELKRGGMPKRLNLEINVRK